MRKAERIVSDKGLVGKGKEARRRKAITLNTIASIHRGRGKLKESLALINQAAVVADSLLHNVDGPLKTGHVSPHAVAVLTFQAKGLANLDRGGKSDPFLRVAKTGGSRNKWREGKDAALGREVGKTVRRAGPAGFARPPQRPRHPRCTSRRW